MDANSALTGTTDEAGASQRIGLSVSTLQKYRVTGAGPRFGKLGRRVVYRIADLDAWLSARIVSSTSERRAA